MLGLLVLVFGLLATFSRSAWAGLAVGFAFYAVFSLRGRDVRCAAAKKALIKVSAALLALSAAFSLIYAPVVKTRMLGAGRLEAKSLAERKSGSLSACQMIQSRPWLGAGAGNYTLELSGLELPEGEAQRLSEEIVTWRRNTIFRLNEDSNGDTTLFHSWLCKWDGRVSAVKHAKGK